MSTDTTLPFSDVIPPAELADMEAIIAALCAGKKPDPEVANRVRERADRIREETFRKHGLLDIGVPAIRALRDGDDE